MMRLIADFMITTSLRARKSATTAQSRRTRAASIIRSSITIRPSRNASSAGSISSSVVAVRKPRPPRFTPRSGVPRSPTERDTDSSVPSPPRTMMRSTCPGRSARPTAVTDAWGTRPAVSLSSTTERPRSSSQTINRSTTSRARPASGLATIPTRFMTTSSLGQGLHGPRDQRLDVGGGLAVRGHVQEKLAVALRAAERRCRDSEDVPTAQHRVASETGHDLSMERRLAHHAPFADQVLTHFELRLDQRHRLAARREDVENGRKHLLQRDERDVHDGKGRLVTEDPRVEGARVRLLHDDDPRVAPQAGVQLPGAHIDGIHARGPALEETIGETAGGRANVEADLADDVDVEVIKGVGQLLTGATDKGRSPSQLHLGLGRDQGAGFVDSLPVHEYIAGHDQLSCLLSAVHQSALDNHPVDPDTSSHRALIIGDLGAGGGEQRAGPCPLGSPQYGQTRPRPRSRGRPQY